MRATGAFGRIAGLLAMVLVLVGLSLGMQAVAQVTGARAAGSPEPGAAQTAAAFTPAQRAEIVAVVRAALLADPSILRDALDALQAGAGHSQEVAARAAIGHAGPALTQDRVDPSAGNPAGDVTVVEFYDLRCPYCREMLPVLAALLAHDARVRLVFKDIPVLGPPSALAARAVLAAQRQGGYLRLQHALMAGGGQITEASLHVDADRAGLDWGRLRRDMAAPGIQAHIESSLALARRLGIDGTPSFVVGTKLLIGAIPLQELQAAVAAARGGNG